MPHAVSPSLRQSGWPPTLGLVLAGGQGRRLGIGDKALVRCGGATLLEQALARLRGQSALVVVSSNGAPPPLSASPAAVVSDSVAGFPGPLAGLLAGMDWAAAHAPDLAWIASIPVDCPFLPLDLVGRLHAARAAQGAPLACAVSGGRRHHLAALWPVALREDLRRAVMAEGLRKVETWTARHGVALAEWPVTPVDPFFNINTPADLAEAERLAAAVDG